eukprot:gb/GECG01016470.1/.p1 GENE.gb/GECG01016470.1/~~gb/GECG01016470.1/.p1  ORF type:complete len:385 (+),score=38.30 gb/GECG01016470.1/:1-1155(+)
MESFGGLHGIKRLQKADGENITILGSAHAGFNMSRRIREVLQEEQGSWIRSAPEVVAIEFGQYRMDTHLDRDSRQKAQLAPLLEGAPVVRCIHPLTLLNTLSVLPAAFVLSALCGDTYGEDMYLTAHYVTQQMPETKLVCIDRDQFVTMARWEISVGDVLPLKYLPRLIGGLIFYRKQWIVSALRQWSDETALDFSSYLSKPLSRRLIQFDKILIDAYERQAMSQDEFEQAKECMTAATTAPIFAARQGCPTELTGLHPALVQERDKILSYNLYNLPGKNAVAVVGIGHLEGIEEHWGQLEESEVRELLKPPPHFTFKTCVLPSIAAVGSACGLFYLHRRKILPLRTTAYTLFSVAAVGTFIGFRAVQEMKSLVNVIHETRQQR